jgi:pimeloyl-ACP methyl ester carboxylesterase
MPILRFAAPKMRAGKWRPPSGSSSTTTECSVFRSSRIPGARFLLPALRASIPPWSIALCCSAQSAVAGPAAYEKPPTAPAWRVVTLEDQWGRFVEDVPPGEPPVLSRLHFEEWGERYLDADPDSRRRDPPGVKIPTGPFTDILHAWHGDLGYDPALVRAPVAIVRGEWDGLIPDEDARWLFDAFAASPLKRDIKISRATHLMHLEAMRFALYRESIAFLQAGDEVSIPQIG